MNRNANLSVLIVSWNECGILRRCIGSVIDQSEEVEIEIIVVDNASGDGSVAMVRREFPHVTVIENNENLGFARAVNQALRCSRGRYVFVFNPDAVVADRALDRMMRFLDSHPDVGAVGPRLVREDGQPDYLHSPKRFPTLWDDLREALRLRPRVYVEALGEDRSVLEDGRAVEVMPGGCLMVRMEAIEETGELDERFFVFGEDVDWCTRLRQAGWEVRWWPGVTVVHAHRAGPSVSRWPWMSLQGRISRDELYRKYRGEAYAWRYRLLVGTVALMKGLVWAVLGMVPGGVAWQRNCDVHRALHARIIRWALRGRREGR